MSAFDAAMWLGGERGDAKLSALLQSWLLEAHKDGIWDENDVPGDDTGLTKKKAELWDSILEDAAKTAKATVGKAQRVRLMHWLDPVTDAQEDEDASKVYVPSRQCKEDLLVQGASNHWDLIFSELSLVSGRPASRAELLGGIYAGPASLTVGGKMLIKSKEKTFDAELQLATAAGSTALIDSWITRLAGLCTDSDYPYAPIFASNLLKFWMKAKQNLKEDGLVLTYMREHRGDKVGRGFPLAYDGELADRARANGRPVIVGGGAGDSASNAHRMAAASQMDEVLKAVQSVSSRLVSMEGKLSTVQQKVQGMETKGVGASVGVPLAGKVCLACGSAEHAFKDCPNVPDGFEPPSWYKKKG